jgi:hypothetical protein
MVDLNYDVIKELFDLHAKHEDLKHNELKSHIIRVEEKVDLNLQQHRDRLRTLETAKATKDTFRSYWKPLLIAALTAVIVGGLANYGS